MTPLFQIEIGVNKHWSQKNNNTIRRTGQRLFVGKQQKLINDKNWLILQLRQAWQNKKTISRPVHVKLTFAFKDFYTAKNEMNLKLGDLDNLLCLPLDALTIAGIIRDDALVMSLDGSRKAPGTTNKLSIEINEFVI